MLGLNSIIAKGAALAAIAASAAAFWFYADAERKADRILELEIQAWSRDADIRALSQRGDGVQRVEISYRDAIQGLDPNALSAICLAELGPTYDAVERMRNDARSRAAGRTSGRLPRAGVDAKSSD